MRRREFLTLLGGAAVTWPLVARAQQRSAGKIARIGFLGASSQSNFVPRLEQFRLGLRELGYVEGENIRVEYRWAEGKYERLPELAGQLVRSDVDLIVTHSTPGAIAAKQATATIPIVVANVGDPIAAGVVTSVARPGGNITALSFFSPQLAAKRIELLKELAPQLARVAILLNGNNPISEPVMQAKDATARSLNLDLQEFPVRSPSDFANAFERMEQAHIIAVSLDEDAMLTANLPGIATLASNRRLLSVGPKDFARAGGLMGYGADTVKMFHRAATLVDKILKGTKPADIPFEQATRFDFILNLKLAKAIGLDVPPLLLVRADEVIE